MCSPVYCFKWYKARITIELYNQSRLMYSSDSQLGVNYPQRG